MNFFLVQYFVLGLISLFFFLLLFYLLRFYCCKNTAAIAQYHTTQHSTIQNKTKQTKLYLPRVTYNTKYNTNLQWTYGLHTTQAIQIIKTINYNYINRRKKYLHDWSTSNRTKSKFQSDENNKVYCDIEGKIIHRTERHLRKTRISIMLVSLRSRWF